MKSTYLKTLNSHWPFSITVWVLLFISMFSSSPAFPQVSINNDGSAPDASAMLEVKSSNRGILFPRMNFASRPATPVTGLAIYQLDNNPGFYFYDGSAWQKMSLAAYDFWNPNGNDIYFSAGHVGIGVTAPDSYGLNVQNYIYGKSAIRGADQSGSNVYAEGHLGVFNPVLIGAPFSVTNVGVMGIKYNNGYTGAAVYGWNNDANLANYGGIFYSDGANVTNGTNYAVYAVARNADANYAGYFKGRVSVEGNSGSNAGDDTTSTLFSVHVNHSYSANTYAITGTSTPRPGYGYGVYGTGGSRGVSGVAPGEDYSGTSTGVYGYAYGTAGTRIGVYGNAAGGTANWGSYFIGSNYMSGDLRIGTTTAAAGYKLSVNGRIACTEVLVQAMSNWPDYVFRKNYKLMDLGDLERNIRDNGHLPGLPSAQEVESDGLHLGDMQKQIVEKIEELTLYTIEQGKRIEKLDMEIKSLRAENESLKKIVKK